MTKRAVTDVGVREGEGVRRVANLRPPEARNSRPVMGAQVPFTPDRCQGAKKDGSACKARPVKGELLCIGHARSEEIANADTR